jgi:glycerophosphoryl diester phosphodiesterase
VPPVFRGIPVMTQRFMAAATRLGVDVQVWTVNEPDQMVHLLDLGVGAIMTDRPRVLRDLLQARGQWQPDPSRA